MSVPTACATYLPINAPTGTPQTALITTYSPSALFGAPAFLPVTVVKTITSSDDGYTTVYNVTIGTTDNAISYILKTSDGTSDGFNGSILTQLPRGLDFADFIGLGANNFALANIITLIATNNIPLTRGTFVSGDTYNIDLADACINIDTPGVRVSITRPPPSREFGGSVGNNKVTSIPCLITSKCKKINVPIVSILGQVTVDYSDVGDVIFTICDKYQYYEEEGISCNENKCVNDFINTECLKQTKFRQCCPFMVSVLQGEGDTLREKALYLWEINKVELGISFDDFYGNIIFYGMTKYIFSRILYGKFNIKYLLGKYNSRFIKDLGRSRFCGAIVLYEDCEQPSYGYNQYFLVK
jgi:hypothetical protein